MGQLSQMKSTGAAELLDDAALLLRNRGWSRITHCDQRSGALDLLGALCVAAGAKVSQITEDESLIANCVPSAKQAAVHVALEALSHSLGSDPIAWQYERKNSLPELINAIQVASFHLKRAIND